MDQLAWLDQLELLFREQLYTNNDKIVYAAFHLIGVAHCWYIRQMKDMPLLDLEHFTRCIDNHFGSPIHHEKFSMVSPP